MRSSQLFLIATIISLGADVFAYSIDYSAYISDITDEEHENWKNFKSEHQKDYSDSIEELKRLNIFVKNLRYINDHNGQEKSYILGMNKFGDMAHEEYVNYLKLSEFEKIRMMNTIDESELPKYTHFEQNAADVDWRTKGVVTPVKDQGRCGSCYAFSATGALEAQYSLKNRKLVSFSEQQIVDCSKSFGNVGCNGGNPEATYVYLGNNGGMSEEDYPYTGVEGSCKASSSKEVYIPRRYYSLPEGQEQVLANFMTEKGPVAVVIDAGQTSFQFYKSGVYDEPNCGKKMRDLNHAVLAVGYGSDSTSGEKYFIVKNSWGSDWGEAGYIRMSRDKSNQCGIATLATLPVL